MQATIARSVDFRGVGLHSGAAARLVVHPAEADEGIVFRRTDLPGKPAVPALWDRVTDGRLCTRLQEGEASVSTVEHVMAALAGCGIHNARLDLDGPEVPILDGSAAPFVVGLTAAGLRRQSAPVQVIRVLREVEVRQGEAWARLTPDDGFEIDFAIDFKDEAIGRQQKRLDMANGAFLRELADSRTFCRQSDVFAMQQAGLALGGTYFNAVVVDGDRILSPGGLRHADEAVRHKMLDAMGDLALAGGPLLARYTASRGGHALTNRLLRALFAAPGAHAVIASTRSLAARLPGAGVLTSLPVRAAANDQIAV